jgi:UDP-N-acetylglucosamine--N-acetylmuramyl-(pentapeptide) pyrophosphoryl-undecaprenol N-acetylglucosamine transferase
MPGMEEGAVRSMADRPVKVIIAGGGTGGHLFPGIAIADEFMRRGHEEILFVGTGNALEREIFGGLSFPFQALRIKGVKGKGWVRASAALLDVPGSLIASYRIIRLFHPRVVIGVGGYVSGPVVLVAWMMGARTAIAEQNALPGLTNRILGVIVDKVFLTYRETRKWFSPERAVVTGNPVRAEVLKAAGDAPHQRQGFTLLIFGGSQGARSINRVIVHALSRLREIGLALKIIHQTGAGDLSYVSEIYRQYGIAAEVTPFIRDMAGAYGAADLVICRAGATSIAELTVMGKASILIPFPFAVDDHQRKNAEILARAGAAVVLDERGLDGKEMAEAIERLYRHPELLRDMERKSASLGRGKAAADIVDQCLELVGAH